MSTAPVTTPAPTFRAIRIHFVGIGRKGLTVCVRAADGTTWTETRAAIRDIGIAVPDVLYAGSTLLVDDTVLGRHPLLNGVQLSAAPTAQEPRHLLDLVVTEGPDTGARTALTTQVQRIGRAPSNSLSLQDPGLSRTHLVAVVDQGRAMISDVGTTNGSQIDGLMLRPEQPIELRAGQRLRAGSTTFALERSLPTDRSQPGDASCRIPFQRSSRTPPQINETNLSRPTPPGRQERHKLPWPVIVLPMVMSLAMVVFLHNAMFLMFAFLGPAMMVGQYITDRQGGSARTKRQRSDHEAALRRLEADRKSAIASELGLRRRITPPVSDTLRVATLRDNRLWARSPTHADFLQCRVGTGDVPSEIRVAGGDSRPERVMLHDAPIAISLNESRVVGVAGAHDLRPRMLDGLLLQLATAQSPHFVRLVIICDTAMTRSRWGWASGLPHVTAHPHAASTVLDFETSETDCQRMLSELLPAEEDRSLTGRNAQAVSTVVVLDGSGRLCNRPEVTALLQAVERAGVAVIATGERSELPSECDVVGEIVSSTSVCVSGAVNARGCPDLPRRALSRAVAARLAAICDATPDATGGAVPDRAALIDVWREEGCAPTDAAAIADHWRTTVGSTVAPLGVSAEGPLRIDLATDGPHGLIAGTTGAGKSELLQSLVTSLALVNRPDQLVFVLVDYKGGAAFQECAKLPHTVGLVTDLDAHLTARALTSLGAEVRRREQQLGSVGAKDIEDYLRVPGAPPLPRLVLVIDEFRVLAEEMPDFIDGLVRIAAVGRSLGIHLVLATQRPAGVVSADIRANVNLRIALRVRDSADSQDVIETADAAAIPAALPGRAIVRTGGGRPITFQTARIGGSSIGQAEIEVAVVETPGAVPVTLTTAAAADGPTDLHRVVDAIGVATRELAVQVPESPWLPALPHQVLTSELPPDTRGISGRPSGDEAIPFGLLDLPQEQRTCTITWDPEQDGHLAIIGGPRSGRTTLLRTIAAHAATRWPAGGLAIYVVDTSSGLGALQALPQCGAVIERDDVSRLGQLVQWLSDEVRSRQQQFAGESIGGYAEHLRVGGDLPRVLVLVDGWEAFNEISEDSTLGRMTEELLQVLRDGSAVGIHAAVTGGRSLATGRVVSSFASRLVLRLADAADAVLLSLREADLPETMPPGRAVTCPAASELQVATPIRDLSGAAVAQHLSRIGHDMDATDVYRFVPMPEHCARAELPSSASQVVIGIGGPEVSPVGLPFNSFGDAAALIAGPARSGRTTALVTVAHQLGARGVCWIPGRGRAPDLPAGTEVLDPAEPEKLAAWLNAHPGGAVLVDDLDELLGSTTDELLTDYLQHGRRSGGIVCASGQSDTLANTFRGVAAELRRKQTGIILQPGRRDGDLLGATLGPAGRALPGRGALVIRGRAVVIQVAA